MILYQASCVARFSGHSELPLVLHLLTRRRLIVCRGDGCISFDDCHHRQWAMREM